MEKHDHKERQRNTSMECDRTEILEPVICDITSNLKETRIEGSRIIRTSVG